MERTKAGILKKQEMEKPELFIEYSAYDYSTAESGDKDIIEQKLEDFYGLQLDKDMHCVAEELVYELIRDADIKVLVNPKMSKDSVLQLLDKIMNRIKADDRYRLAAKEELRKITKLNEIESEMQNISENEDLEDVEYLLATIKEMVHKKKEKIMDYEFPF